MVDILHIYESIMKKWKVKISVLVKSPMVLVGRILCCDQTKSRFRWEKSHSLTTCASRHASVEQVLGTHHEMIGLDTALETIQLQHKHHDT